MIIKRFSSLVAVMASLALVDVSALPVSDTSIASANDLPPIPGLLQDITTTSTILPPVSTSSVISQCTNAVSCPKVAAVQTTAQTPTITMTYMLTQTPAHAVKTPEAACVAPAAAIIQPTTTYAVISCPQAKPTCAPLVAAAAQVPPPVPTTIYTYVHTKAATLPTAEAAYVPASVMPCAQPAIVTPAPMVEKCQAPKPMTTETVFYTATFTPPEMQVLSDTQKSARDDRPMIDKPVTAEELPPSINNGHLAPVIIPAPLPPILPTYQVSAPPPPILDKTNPAPSTSLPVPPVQYFTIFTTETPTMTAIPPSISVVTITQSPVTVVETVTITAITTETTSLKPITTTTSSPALTSDTSSSTSSPFIASSLSVLTTSAMPTFASLIAPTTTTQAFELPKPTGISIPDPASFQI